MSRLLLVPAVLLAACVSSPIYPDEEASGRADAAAALDAGTVHLLVGFRGYPGAAADAETGLPTASSAQGWCPVGADYWQDQAYMDGWNDVVLSAYDDGALNGASLSGQFVELGAVEDGGEPVVAGGEFAVHPRSGAEFGHDGGKWVIRAVDGRSRPVDVYGDACRVRFEHEGRTLLVWDGAGTLQTFDVATGYRIQAASPQYR